MEFFIEKDTLKAFGEKNPLESIIAKILETGSEDFIACFLSGCTMDITTDNSKMTIKTRYPVSILKHPNGTILSIIEKRI
jgi:hypothetical protein